MSYRKGQFVVKKLIRAISRGLDTGSFRFRKLKIPRHVDRWIGDLSRLISRVAFYAFKIKFPPSRSAHRNKWQKPTD